MRYFEHQTQDPDQEKKKKKTSWGFITFIITLVKIVVPLHEI